MILPAATAASADWTRSRMLKTRVLTALVIALLVLLALFFLAGPIFAVVAGLVLLGAGGWEAARLAGLHAPSARIAAAATLVACGGALSAMADPASTAVLMIVPAALWLLLLSWLSAPGLGRSSGAGWISVKLLALGLILLAAWASISWLQARSPWLVVQLLIIIAAADIGAYFTGRAIGGPKLAPRISPGKTWSGVAGGLLATVIISAWVSSWLPDSAFSPLIAGAVALVLAALSIGGDLFISLLKRQQGLKDSSQLLPGHGGILDRVDSLGLALPFFVLAVSWLGKL